MSACECFKEDDKRRMMAIIERHPGGVKGFDMHMQSLAQVVLEHTVQRNSGRSGANARSSLLSLVRILSRPSTSNGMPSGEPSSWDKIRAASSRSLTSTWVLPESMSFTESFQMLQDSLRNEPSLQVIGTQVYDLDDVISVHSI